MSINLAHPEVTPALFRHILTKMSPVTLTRTMRTCKHAKETINENKEKFNSHLPDRHLMFEIAPKKGQYGIQAESSVITFSLELDAWNAERSEYEKTRVVFCQDKTLSTFLIDLLPRFAIFRYGLIMFRFENESVMLRVLASLRKYNFRCDEIFYALCPTFPLAISTLRPIRISACCQPNVNWINCSYNKKNLSYTFLCRTSSLSKELSKMEFLCTALNPRERFCIFDSKFELSRLMEDIIEKTVRVELMSCSFRPKCYAFVIQFMRKLIEEDNDTLEMWATLVEAPMPSKILFDELGSYLQTRSATEMMVMVIASETKYVCLNVIQAPMKDSVSLFLRRYRSIEEYKEYYTYVSLDPNRNVLEKMLSKVKQTMNKLKIK